MNKTIGTSGLENTASSLVDQMKVATTAHHRKAERAGVIRDILKCRVTLPAYRTYLRHLFFVYSALEDGTMMERERLERLAPFMPSELLRLESLAHDLDALHGDKNWRHLPLVKSCSAYVAHIEALRRDQPIGLLGHIYVRYLGDLNGGQVLERLLKDTLQLENGTLNFYRFSEIKELARFRSEYRGLFDRVGLTAVERLVVINAAVSAFEFNIELSEDVNALV